MTDAPRLDGLDQGTARAAPGGAVAPAVPLRTVEVLASALLHDLISPVSAIGNGVELLEEAGAAVDDPAIDLIGQSAATLNARLQVMRLIYGAGGAQTSLGPQGVCDLVAPVLDTRLTLDWMLPPDHGIARRAGGAKVLAGYTLLLGECAVRGGRLTVDGGEAACRLTLDSARPITQTETLDLAFGAGPGGMPGDSAPGAVTPRTVRGAVLALMAQRYGLIATREAAGPSHVAMRLRFAPAATMSPLDGACA